MISNIIFTIDNLWSYLYQTFDLHVWNWHGLAQALLTFFLMGLAYYISKLMRRTLKSLQMRSKHFQRLAEESEIILYPSIWLLLQWTAVLAFQLSDTPAFLLHIITTLLTAWVVVRSLLFIIPDPWLSQSVAIIIWTLAACEILGLLPYILKALDKLSFPLGRYHISVLDIVKSTFIISLLLWLANVSAKYIQKRVYKYTNLNASLKVLLGKVLQIIFISLALLMALASIGIDVTSLALFGSAIGVGIGFGLQKIVSNLFCGVILLIDGSIKPGDVIALQEGAIYGWVNKLGSRCVSVRTRSGEEHLIPNEDFITQKVENWSYSDKNKRLKIPIGVSYTSDVRKAMHLLEQAAEDIARVLDSPKPGARLIGFEDSSVKLELRVWISSPEKGVKNVISDIYLRIWELFRKNNISIPYPQRDIHIKSEKPFNK